VPELAGSAAPAPPPTRTFLIPLNTSCTWGSPATTCMAAPDHLDVSPAHLLRGHCLMPYTLFRREAVCAWQGGCGMRSLRPLRMMLITSCTLSPGRMPPVTSLWPAGQQCYIPFLVSASALPPLGAAAAGAHGRAAEPQQRSAPEQRLGHCSPGQQQQQEHRVGHASINR
jgi:hypothetical protein